MVKRKKFSKKLDADLDEDIDYQPSDSDDEFGKEEKILLDNRRGTKKEESEEEVFGIHSSSEEEEEENDEYYGGGVGSDFDSDIEGKGSGDSEAGLPDSKAWGKHRARYYNTDYVDKDFGGMSKEDEELAEIEEHEAATIQKRLMSHMEETDFTLGLLDKVEEKKTELSKKSLESETSEKIVTDLSKLSKSEKIQLLKQESPELFQLIDDFKESMVLAKEKLLPIINLVKNGKISTCPASEFVQTLFSVIINYSTNIVFYLLLKSKRSGLVENHPVVQRLYTYKKIMDEMLLVMEDKLLDQIESLLKTHSEGVKLEPVSLEGEEEQVAKNRAERRKRKMKILEEVKRTEKMIVKKKAKLEARKGEEKPEAIGSESEDDVRGKIEEHIETSEEEDGEDGETKRPITYQMKRNKGLTPRRKKEDRNPRVKNRNKYRKAKIRRKGQVRDVRTEVNRYGGELFGIKSYVSKSIKIKS